MIDRINKEIGAINDTLAWIKQQRSEDYDWRYFELVQCRSALRKVLRAKSEKPAIAAYGESQKGKSYLISNLLQDKGAAFTIKAGGRDVDFIKSINPLSAGKQESTGVVTRFSTYSTHPDKYNKDYPIVAKLLSVTDLVAVLCDGYFNDIKDYHYEDVSVYDKLADNIFNKYKSLPELIDSPMSADDIIELMEYINAHINNAQQISKSVLFAKLALIANRIPMADVPNVFQSLWNKNEYITGLFKRLINLKMQFANAYSVYLPIEAVLHHGENPNTIMSVQCLNNLDWDNNSRVVDVYVKDMKDSFTCVRNVNKSDLCALCSEVVIRIEERFAKNDKTYCIKDLSEEVRRQLNLESVGDSIGEMGYRAPNEMKGVNLFEYVDLLDFPGARSRMGEKEDFLANKPNKENDGNALSKMLLRGKVSFLFNNYCDSKIINILLYCHDNEDIVVQDMYSTIDSWVKKYVGDTPEMRKETVKKTKGVSPLFVIATKFNVDMLYDDNEEKNSIQGINQRFNGRYGNILSDCLHIGSVEWFKNWTSKGESFSSTFLLRDFKFSNMGAGHSMLYRGYDSNEPEPQEKELNLNEAFYQQLRQSFVTNQNVKVFFDNPELAWDVSATINNDGAVFIIQKLTKVSQSIADTRDEQFEKDNLKPAMDTLIRVIDSYYVKDDNSDQISINIRKAKKVNLELDFTCNTDNYFFGHLIQSLQLTQSETYRVVHHLIKGGELNNNNDFKDYEIICNRCKQSYPGWDEMTVEERWTAFIEEYSFKDRTEALEYLEKRHVNSELLFSGRFKKKTNSFVISEAVFNRWCEKINMRQILSSLSSADQFEGGTLKDLIEMIIVTGLSIELTDCMASSIKEYVDVLNVNDANQDLVSDILMSKVNSFVLDFGYSYRKGEDIQTGSTVAAVLKNSNPFTRINTEYRLIPTEDEITSELDVLQTQGALTKSFSDNYTQWCDYMFIAFILKEKQKVKNSEANATIGKVYKSLLEGM